MPTLSEADSSTNQPVVYAADTPAVPAGVRFL